MSKRLFLRAVLGVFLLIPLILAVLPETTALAQAPQVTSTSPQQNELNVAANTNVSVTFDADMDEASINASTFVLSVRSTGFHEGTITYDSQTKTATFNPWQDFKAGELVTVVLTTGIQSSGGTPLDNSFIWSFTILANQGPCAFVHSSYSTGLGPWAVFCADLDQDGHIDLATAVSTTGTVSVFLNNGDGTFGPRSDYPLGNMRFPHSICAADFDGDGDVDLATANSISYDVSVLLNNGDGTFAPRSDYPGGGIGESIFAADLDGDGDIDLAAGGNVFLNNGDGTFGSYSDVPCVHVCAGDLDGDGDLDLAGTFDDDVSIHLNNGDGTFVPDSAYPAGGSSILAGDLDGDGDLDLAAAGWGSDEVSVLFNDGDAIFSSIAVYPVVELPYSVTACDLEGDGDLDLVAVSYIPEPPSVLLNNGDGTFFPCSTLKVGGMCVFAADLDNDGDMDLGTGGRYTSVTTLFNQIAGDCNGDEVIDIADVVELINYLFIDGPAPFPLPAGDANRDGTVDIGDVTYLINYLFTGG